MSGADAIADPRPRRKRSITSVCRSCGYDITGLPSGSPCPECGTPTQRTTGRWALLNDNLTAAPLWYLKLLSLGCVVMALSGLGAVFGMALWKGREYAWAFFGAMICMAVWPAAIWVVTMPRRSAVDIGIDPRKENRISRWTARLTQLGWVGGTVCWWQMTVLESNALVAASIAGTPPVYGPEIIALRIGAGVMLPLALLGIFAVCVQLAELMMWAGNQAVGERLRAAALGVIVGLPTLIVATTVGSRFFPLTVLGVLAGMALAASGIVLLLGLIQTAWESVWALFNSAAAMRRDRRVNLRKQEEMREMVERLPPLPASGVGGTQSSVPENLEEPIPLAPERKKKLPYNHT